MIRPPGPGGEEDPRATEIRAHLDGGDDHLAQAGILDFPQQEPTELAADQVADPVGTSER
jgi:hypothetical protein